MNHNKNTAAVSPSSTMQPGLTRRFLAMLYDAFLVSALVLIACFWFPLLTAEFAASSTGRAIRLGYLLLVMFGFFGWFWTHGGQTLGMRAWRLQLIGTDSESIDWRRALVRYFAAWLSVLPAGLGFFWLLIDRRRWTWHDHLSSSYLIVHPKPSKQ